MSVLLLDLTDVFNTVDPEMLVSPPENWVGIKDTALDWIRSYSAQLTFWVNLGNCMSSSAELLCGVPQASVLGLFSFSLSGLYP